MSHERSNTSSSGGPAKADDLKLINGIGPAVEKRLNDVGICTFAQLAALSPADIAAAVTGISGLASERIIKQDWIGQAHKLAAQSSGSEPDWIEQARQLAVDVPVSRRKDDAELPGETQRSTRATSEQQEKTKTPLDSPRHATFTVELLLSADDEALSTHITHRESGDEKIWDSWPHVELLSFFVQHAQLNQLQQGSWPSGTEELASASPIPEDSEGTVAPTEENETAITGAESSGDIIASTEEATAPIAENNEGVIASKEENEITLPDMEDSRYVVVRMEEREAVPPAPEETPVRATVPSPPMSALRVRELKVVARGTASHRNILPSQQPFDVQLTVDLTGQAELSDDSLEYAVHIYAEGLEDHARHTLAEARGAITARESITITAQGKTIPQGTYRLWTNVTLLSTGKATTQSILSAAHAKGGMLLIY